VTISHTKVSLKFNIIYWQQKLSIIT
jgi:hypothetical protein